MISIDNVHMHSLAHHTRLTPYGLGVVVSHPDVVSLSVVGGLRRVSGALTTNTNGQVANARRLVYRIIALQRTTPWSRNQFINARICADVVLAGMPHHRPLVHIGPWTPKGAPKGATAMLWQWPRHDYPERNVKPNLLPRARRSRVSRETIHFQRTLNYWSNNFM